MTTGGGWEPARAGLYPRWLMSPFWLWMQALIVLCVLASFVIAIVRLV